MHDARNEAFAFQNVVSFQHVSAWTNGDVLCFVNKWRGEERARLV